jgi:hypothetical protein
MIRRSALVSNMAGRSKFRRQDPIRETRQVTGCHGHLVSLSRQHSTFNVQRSAVVCILCLRETTCTCISPLILITDACLIGFSTFHAPHGARFTSSNLKSWPRTKSIRSLCPKLPHLFEPCFEHSLEIASHNQASPRSSPTSRGYKSTSA